MTSSDQMAAIQKADTCMTWMAHGEIYVSFDGTRADVVVPNWIREPHTCLVFGFDLPVPICDLLINQAGISGTLSFARLPVRCEIPWPAVFKVRSDWLDAQKLWLDDVPVAVQSKIIAAAAELERQQKQRAKAAELKRSMRLIKGGAE